MRRLDGNPNASWQPWRSSWGSREQLYASADSHMLSRRLTGEEDEQTALVPYNTPYLVVLSEYYNSEVPTYEQAR